MIWSHKKQQGLSLVELMIAIALGLFLTAGLIELFTNSKQTYRVQDELSRLQENARFAMQAISRDIRMADFAGCNRNTVQNATNHINTASTRFAARHSLGTDAVTNTLGSSIGGTNGAAGAQPALDSPDTLTIINAFQTGLAVLPPFGPLPSDNITIASGNSIEQGDVLLISDCTNADIIQAVNDPSTDDFISHVTGEFSHSTPNVDEPGNINALGACGANPNPALDHCLSKVYNNSATVYSLIVNTYTIATGANGQLALFKNGDELVEGISNLQVLYGEDRTPLDSNINPDSYVPAGTAGLNMHNVISVRVSLVAETEQDALSTQPVSYTLSGDTFTPTDNKIRRVFTSTINLRNRRL